MYHFAIFLSTAMLAATHRPASSLYDIAQATHPNAYSCGVSKHDGHYSQICEFSCDGKTIAACVTPHGGTLTTCKVGDVTVTLPISPC